MSKVTKHRLAGVAVLTSGLAIAVVLLSGGLGILLVWSGHLLGKILPKEQSIELPQHGTVNVSREQYKQALVNWQSQNIETYEASLEYLMGVSVGEITLTVSYPEHTITVVQGHDSEQGAIRVGPAEPESYSWLTIDGLFGRVEDIINNGPLQQGEADKADGSYGFYYDYEIQFDPVMGYPIQVTRRGRAPSFWQQKGIRSSGPSHFSYFITLHNLKVLKRGATHAPVPTATTHP